jgi:hypothetical protein
MPDNISVDDCIRWLDQLDEGATIWDTDIKFIFRIRTALELLTMDVEERQIDNGL